LNRKKVESSNIVSIGWEAGTMEVEFNNGIYQFHNVCEEIYKTFMESESKGKYFHQYIKGTFNAVKVTNDISQPSFVDLRTKPIDHVVSVGELRTMGSFWIKQLTSENEKNACCRESVRAFIKMIFGCI